MITNDDLQDLLYAVKGNALIPFITKHYPLDMRNLVLEPGCGSGKFGTFLALEYDCNVTLLDIDPKYLAYTKRILQSVEVLRGDRLPVVVRFGDIQRLPFKENTFDLVYNEGVVEHWTGPERLNCIQEMARVSRDCVVIITNDAEGEKTKEKVAKTVHHYVSMPEKETPYTAGELKENMEKVGLLMVEVDRVALPVQEYLVGVGYK